ncbi:TPA: hypothetical protein ACUT5J_001519 [Pseudomonas aeruginosa]|uniref:hypothetical protein n=1 Tax=Pseudomonas TaxID=286 RepID=UPI000684E92B|nr:hypothetical protein [Pseudomonas aeruginosa]EKU2298540.1 hypothetical protein [Pseudomonas aeruginosa]EKU2327766.1 hypothetical protein [Pseudomonas aeruginosa]MDG4471647.1 hypothetical protein [Pseudomonas aeruginosa]MDI3619952.1 hypothetical protein [Pseudomonas aeruginosa]MDP5547214.1 hypothetical protein [Pseudomonas aeruginosa]
MSDYEYIKAELFFDRRRGSVRVRPLPGGKYPVDLVIECDKSFREKYPIGSRFLLPVKEKQKKSDDCRPHLYSRYSWGATPID